MSSNSIVLTRAELYEIVWAAPVVDVARRFGVSGVAVAKWCKNMNVPVPPRGYWAKVRAGHAVGRAALPLPAVGMPTELNVVERPPGDAQSTGRIDLDLEKTGPKIIVASRLVRPHPLVAETRTALATAKPRLDGLLCPPAGSLDISVSPVSLDRALRLANSLIRALEERGIGVDVEAPPDRDRWGRAIHTNRKRHTSMWARLDGESIEFSITERRRYRREVEQRQPAEQGRLQAIYPRLTHYEPTGDLVLAIDAGGLGGYVWQDSKRGRIVEDRLNEFVAQLYAVADCIKQERCARTEAARRHAEEERARFARQQRDARRSCLYSCVEAVFLGRQEGRESFRVAEPRSSAREATNTIPSTRRYRLRDPDARRLPPGPRRPCA